MSLQILTMVWFDDIDVSVDRNNHVGTDRTAWQRIDAKAGKLAPDIRKHPSTPVPGNGCQRITCYRHTQVADGHVHQENVDRSFPECAIPTKNAKDGDVTDGGYDSCDWSKVKLKELSM